MGLLVGLLVVVFGKYEVDEIQAGVSDVIQDNRATLEMMSITFALVILVFFIVPFLAKFFAKRKYMNNSNKG
jgi:uncharacterized membrane protein YdjX (TVP38/TMEM64 family)